MRKSNQEKSSERRKALSSVGEKLPDGWDRAIFEAQKKITKLQNSILIFEEMRDKGEPFPSEAKSDLAQK